MSVLAGVEQLAVAPTLAELEAGFDRWPTEVEPGWHVRHVDGSWSVVVDEPTTLPRDMMSIPVTDWAAVLREAADADGPEQLLVGAGRKVRTRTPAEQRAYLRALHDEQDDPEMHLQLANGHPSLCGKPVKPLWRTTVYGWASCVECVEIADRMMAAAEAAEAAQLAEAPQGSEAGDGC